MSKTTNVKGVPIRTKRKAEYQSLVDKVQSLQSRALSIVEEFHSAAEKLLNMPIPVELLLSSAARLPKGKGLSLRNVLEGTLGPTCAEGEAEETAENFRVLHAQVESLLRFESPSIGKVPDLIKTVDLLRERKFFTTSLWSRRLQNNIGPTSGSLSDRGMISKVARKVDAPNIEEQHDAKSGFFQTNPAPGE